MTFDQAQGMFRTHKTYETAYTYLAVASQRKAVKATNPDTFFNAVGEVASWLSASDAQLLAFEAARTKGSACLAGRSNPTTGLVQSGESAPATFASCQPFQNFPRIY
jgi:hypothetical protein